jgi:hypothetical protein
MLVMLQTIEAQERRSTPATVKDAPAILASESHDDAAGQHTREPSSESTNCLWCQRVFMPRRTGGSPQRFCSTEHRQAFWIAARRWTMRAVEAGLLNVECLKVP